jgi:hypothetical protein
MVSSNKFPLLPKATAVWLVENTCLTFKQIADFCGMHELEIKGIADGEVAQGIQGLDPIIAKQLTTEEIKRCSELPEAKLQILETATFANVQKKKQQAKYTPIARRQDKPDAIYWLLKNCPLMQETEIVKLVGTTKSTIETIKNKSHWNMTNIRARDPVLLGICSQVELDKILSKQNLSVPIIFSENNIDKN